MCNSDLRFNEREYLLKKFYSASGFLIKYLCDKEKLFRRTEEYYVLKGAGSYPVDLKKLTAAYCRILEWTSLLSLKDEKVRQAIDIVLNTAKSNIDNPTPEEYIRKYMTLYTINSVADLV